MKYRENEVEDETEYLQWGQSNTKYFWEFRMGEIQPSSWIYFPTEEKPSNLFKYISVFFDVSQDRLHWTR